MPTKFPQPPGFFTLLVHRIGLMFRCFWWDLTDSCAIKNLYGRHWGTLLSEKEKAEAGNFMAMINPVHPHRDFDLPDFVGYGNQEWRAPRRGGGPTKINSSGSQIWENSRRVAHRHDGPAIIGWIPETSFKGVMEVWAEAWCRDGQYHRTDGPAIIDQYQRIRYYLNGMEITPSMMQENGIEVLPEEPWFKNNTDRMIFMGLGDVR